MRQVLEAGAVERRQERAGVAVAQVEFVASGVAEIGQDALRQSTGAVTAAREPQGVDIDVVRHLEEGLGANGVIAGEMTRGAKALRMEDDLRYALGIKLRGESEDTLGDSQFDA